MGENSKITLTEETLTLFYNILQKLDIIIYHLSLLYKDEKSIHYRKRWQEYTEELYKKDLHDQDTHDGVIIHLEPDILECEVRWALGSITMNKASGGDGIPVELFQILKDGAVKVLYSICQRHRTGKGQFSFQSQRKAMPKNLK